MAASSRPSSSGSSSSSSGSSSPEIETPPESLKSQAEHKDAKPEDFFALAEWYFKRDRFREAKTWYIKIANLKLPQVSQSLLAETFNRLGQIHEQDIDIHYLY